MNIAFFSECYRPTSNGVVVSIDTFARQLRQFGHFVHLYAPQYRGYHDTVSGISRIPSIRLPLVPEYPVPIPIGFRIAQHFGEKRFDIVHTQSAFTLSHLGASLASRFNLPLISTFHTMLLEYLHYIYVPPWLSRPFVVNIVRRHFNQCDLVIVPATSIASVLRGLGVETEIQPLPTGIDVNFMRGGDGDRIRSELGIPRSSRMLLYVGRLAREKNVDFLLEAVAETMQAHQDTTFVLVGTGPLKPRCERWGVEHGLASRVHLVGSIPSQEVRDYYMAADVFVFASKTETQGLVVGEAMACGLPVVAVRAGGVTEFINSGEDGFLVDENQASFVRTVNALLTSADLHRALSAAAPKKAEQFSAESSTRRLEGFYRVLIESKKSSRTPPHERFWGASRTPLHHRSCALRNRKPL